MTGATLVAALRLELEHVHLLAALVPDDRRPRPSPSELVAVEDRLVRAVEQAAPARPSRPRRRARDRRRASRPSRRGTAYRRLSRLRTWHKDGARGRRTGESSAGSRRGPGDADCASRSPASGQSEVSGTSLAPRRRRRDPRPRRLAVAVFSGPPPSTRPPPAPAAAPLRAPVIDEDRGGRAPAHLLDPHQPLLADQVARSGDRDHVRRRSCRRRSPRRTCAAPRSRRRSPRPRGTGARAARSRRASPPGTARTGRAAAPRRPRSGSACRPAPRARAAVGRARRGASATTRGCTCTRYASGVGLLVDEVAQLALDLERDGLLGQDDALAVAGRADLGEDLAHPVGHVLARHLDRARAARSPSRTSWCGPRRAPSAASSARHRGCAPATCR